VRAVAPPGESPVPRLSPARPPRADGSPYAAGATLPLPPPVAAPGLLGLEGGRPYRFPAMGIGLGAAGFACLLATAALLCWWCRARSRARVAAPCCSHKLSGDSLEPGLSAGSIPTKARAARPPARPLRGPRSAAAAQGWCMTKARAALGACVPAGARGGPGAQAERAAHAAGPGVAERPGRAQGRRAGGARAQRHGARVALAGREPRGARGHARLAGARPRRAAAPAPVGGGGLAGVRVGRAPVRLRSRGRSRRGRRAPARRRTRC